MKKLIHPILIFGLLVSAFVLTGCYSTSSTASRGQYDAPDWAPAYEPGVRYYYIPDIQTYYDVTSRNFVYLDHGQWIYSSNLPPVYSGYNLYNGYAVALDRRVYEPWRYHQNYEASYPPYYYRNMYPNQNAGTVRGYNENARRPIYSNQARSRHNNTTNNPAPVNPAPANNQRTNTTPPVHPAPSPQANRLAPATNPTPTSPSTTTDSRRVGKPVKVTPDMRQPANNNSSYTPGSRRGTSTSSPSPPQPGNSRSEQQKTIPSTTTAPAPVTRGNPSTQTSDEKRQDTRDRKDDDSGRRR